jgi:hypothetical protein
MRLLPVTLLLQKQRLKHHNKGLINQFKGLELISGPFFYALFLGAQQIRTQKKTKKTLKKN